MASITLSPSSASGWTNSSNVTASDNSYATSTVAKGEDFGGSGMSVLLTVSFPAAGLAADDVIDGVEVRIERNLSSSTGGTKTIQLEVAGSGTANGPSTWTTSDVTETNGTPSDLWGMSWTAASFNSGFDVAFRAGFNNGSSTKTASVDYVSVTIYYHPGLVEKSVADAGTITATESLEISATVPLADSGTVSATDDLSVSATLPLADAGTITATDDLTVAASFTLTDSGTVTAAENLVVEIIDHVSLSDSGTITADESLTIGPQLVDSGTVTATEALTVDASTPLADSGTISATEAMQIAFGLADDGTITAAEALAISATVPLADSGTVSATEHLQIKSIDIVTEPRVALDVYDLSGNRLGSGPIATPLAASYSMRADEIGTFRATVPAIAANADVLAAGREIRIRRAGEGEVFRGILDQPKVVVGEDGAILLELAGQSTAARLVWANTLLGRTFSGATVATAVSTLLAGTGWTAGAVDSATISARFDGATVWKALRNIAETLGWHAVEDPLTQRVSLAAASGSSGLVFRQVDHAGPEMAVIPLTGLTIPATEQAIWNRIIPLGAGEGINALSLRFSGRSSPYTIQTATGPDGNTYWYLEDAASVAAYGARTQVLKFDEIAPLSNSAAEETAAANTLYDAASAWLGYYANPTEFYEASVVGLTHYAGGTPRFTIGQTVRLQWTGIVTDDAGTRLWKSVDANVYLMGFEREFHESGSDSWRLELATVDRRQPGPGDAIVKAIDDLWAIKTAMRPYTYREIHGPSVESVASGQPATLPVTFDDNVSLLHKAVLTVRKRRVKSNVTGAAAGGGQTTSSGGGATSSGGSSHSHTIALKTTTSSGGHSHLVGDFYPTTTWSDPAYMQQITMKNEATGMAYGFYVGRNGTEAGSGKFESFLTTPHTHDVDGQTSSSESSHTHTVPSHSHSVGDHTHPMSYGIYLGPAAGSPAFTITINGTDRTAALGGPWNGDISVDITPYLVDANGHVLRQVNSVVIGAAQLCDVEMTVRSLVSATSIVPV